MSVSTGSKLTMYRPPFSTAGRILIVKTSSLGDIIQSFIVLNYLKNRFPDASIDWAVEKRFASIVKAHPLINRAIVFDSKARRFGEYISSAKDLRRVSYDFVFDLQGNCKSGVVTLLAKSRCKVGYGKKTVREWPNLLATHHRFNVSSNLNIRLQLLGLIRRFLGDLEFMPPIFNGIRFKISCEDKQKIEALLVENTASERIMVCPGSQWKNKQLPLSTMREFLEKIERWRSVAFFLVWGNEEEKQFCLDLQKGLKNSLIVDRLDLPVWQNLMSEMDMVIALDSGALHLCGTTSTPSFSIFGPTMPEIFKPISPNHFSMRGECPYFQSFEKQCPKLRSCPTGACIRSLTADEIFNRFSIIHRNRCASLPTQ